MEFSILIPIKLTFFNDQYNLKNYFPDIPQIPEIPEIPEIAIK
jgi:hypothetical protein